MKSIHRVVICLACLSAVPAHGEVRLPTIFSDNMVLQKSDKAPFFGTADKGEKVTVKVGDASGEATAGDDGKWKLFVDTRGVKGAVDVSVAGNNSIAIRNVLVGEVWVASGQSNMEFTVGSGRDADLEIAAANYPEIRMFTVQKATSLEPAKDVRGTWEVCTPAVTGHFSAVGYFFARDLNQQMNVPVGVIHTSWGGTVAEAWTSMTALGSDASLAPVFATRGRMVDREAAGIRSRRHSGEHANGPQSRHGARKSDRGPGGIRRKFSQRKRGRPDSGPDGGPPSCGITPRRALDSSARRRAWPFPGRSRSGHSRRSRGSGS